jgi:AraC-like DNA-binding protein/mannose-6-phosphate isomerase-like protein (cupin superfamily)
MNQDLLNSLRLLTEEEKELLNGCGLKQERYTYGKLFEVDSRKLLRQGQLIDIRTHTRFVSFPKHTHDYIEILYMCSGSTLHIINDTELKLETGDVLFIGKGCWHEVMPAGMDDIGVNFIVMPEFFHTAFDMMEGRSILSDFIIDNLTGRCSKIPYLHFHVADVLPVQNLLENLVWSLHSGFPGQREDEITMGLLFLQLMRCTGRTQDVANRSRFAMEVLHYIDESYENATVTELAARMCRPGYWVSREVKAEFGMPFKDLLQKKRFREALSCLTETRLPVCEIAASVGYENTSYFFRRFREKYGISPTEYRRRHAKPSRK